MCWILFAIAAFWYWTAMVAAIEQSNAQARLRAAQDYADAIAQERQDEEDDERAYQEDRDSRDADAWDGKL